jgi:hypothetical protein
MKSYSSTVRDNIYANQFIAVDLLELHLTDINKAAAPLYFTNAGMEIKYDSPTAPTAGVNTYTGLGEFVGFSTVSEDFDIKVGKFSIQLSGIANDFVNKFVYQDPTSGNRVELEGKRVVIYKAFLDINNGLSVVNSPVVIYDGIIYNIAITESSSSCQITIDCSTLFSDFERNAGRKTNNGSNWQYQGSTYDTSFKQAGFVGNTEYKWGKL